MCVTSVSGSHKYTRFQYMISRFRVACHSGISARDTQMTSNIATYTSSKVLHMCYWYPRVPNFSPFCSTNISFFFFFFFFFLRNRSFWDRLLDRVSRDKGLNVGLRQGNTCKSATHPVMIFISQTVSKILTLVCLMVIYGLLHQNTVPFCNTKAS